MKKLFYLLFLICCNSFIFGAESDPRFEAVDEIEYHQVQDDEINLEDVEMAPVAQPNFAALGPQIDPLQLPPLQEQAELLAQVQQAPQQIQEPQAQIQQMQLMQAQQLAAELIQPQEPAAQQVAIQIPAQAELQAQQAPDQQIPDAQYATTEEKIYRERKNNNASLLYHVYCFSSGTTLIENIIKILNSGNVDINVREEGAFRTVLDIAFEHYKKYQDIIEYKRSKFKSPTVSEIKTINSLFKLLILLDRYDARSFFSNRSLFDLAKKYKMKRLLAILQKIKTQNLNLKKKLKKRKQVKYSNFLPIS